MDAKTVRKLEEEIEDAIAEVIVHLGLAESSSTDERVSKSCGSKNSGFIATAASVLDLTSLANP